MVANAGTDSIGISLNNRDGTFAQQVTSSTGMGSRPYSVAVGDFNNDTHSDIIVANFGTNSVGVLLGYGDGQFAHPLIFSLNSSRPLFLVVGDLNNDSAQDVVMANYGTATIAILFGMNDGSFRTHYVYEMNYDSVPYSLALADINNDHHLDIVVVNYGTSELVIFLANQNQSFSIHKYWTSPGSHPTSVTTGHFNTDGILDIAVAYSGTNCIGIFLGQENGIFTNQTIYSIDVDSQAQFIAVNDFNNDTYADIIVVDSKHNNILVLHGHGNGSFSIKTRHSTGFSSDPSAVVIGDFDNDQKPDVAISNNGTNNILLLTAYRIFPAATRAVYMTDDGTVSKSIDLADFNHDNYLDVVICDDFGGNTEVFLNFGNRTFRNKRIQNIGSSSEPNFVITGDVNNDHHPDIVVALDDDNTIRILLGDGEGNFVRGSLLSTGDTYSTSTLALGDLNKDGNLDVIAANYQASNVGLFLGFGDGTFTEMTVIFQKSNFAPNFVKVTHINADQGLDIVISNGGGTGGLVVLLGHGNGSFHKPLLISTDGDILDAFAISDINGDRRSDIVYISQTSAAVGTLFGKGNGAFGTVTKYLNERGAGLRSVSLGYYDDDAFLDAAVSLRFDSSINIYQGIGNGSFKPPITLASEEGSQPYPIVFADLDNDNRQDILLGDFVMGFFQIFYIYSDADFTEETSYLTGSNPHPVSISIGDLNTDGQSDIAVANSGNNDIQLLINYNENSFMNMLSLPTGLGSHPQSVTIADLNQDQLLDIAVANAWDDSMNVFLGLGNGSFTQRYVYSTGNSSAPKSIATADLNKDGRLDLVTANEGTDSVSVFFAFDYVSFTTHMIDIPDSRPQPIGIATGDFNNDHLLDIVVGNMGSNTLGIYLGYGNGTFSGQITLPIEDSSMTNSLTVDDLNHDNCLDLAFVNLGTGTLGVFLGYGNGSFQSLLSYSIGDWCTPFSIAIADMNRDNQADIIVSGSNENSEGTVWLFLGAGNGSFERNQVHSIADGMNIRWLAVDDLNNDTFLDIAFVNSDANSVGLIFGYGNGSFGNMTTLFTGNNSEPYSLALGDLNGDKTIDIAAANRLSGTISLFFGYGNGTFSSQRIPALRIDAYDPVIVIHDVNNDTILDILFTDNQRASRIGIFYGFGDGNFTLPKTYFTDLETAPAMMATGDFNNDSKVDIVVSYFNRGSIGVFIQSGSELFATAALFSTGNQSRPTSVALGDFNSDNYLDIVVTNSFNDSIGVLLGYGNGEFAPQLTYSTGANSRPNAITVDYFNNDHYLDIAVVNTVSSSITIFLGHENGSFTELVSYSTDISSAPVAINARDLNRDNHSDLVVANQGSNEILIFLGQGNGTFVEVKRYSVGYNARPQSVSIGDINHDGMLDIAVANYGTGNVEILLQTC